MAKRVVLYARVSTDEQARSGYSIAGQLEELRTVAAQEGLAVVEEVVDAGYSRSTLERPGLDRVREMVMEGKADEVLAWRRDRFGAAPIPLILNEEFKAADCRMRALDSAGEGDDAEFLGEIKDAMAKLELRTMATRSRLGRLQKARQGRMVASPIPDYGFEYNAERDGYEIDEETMPVVRRIFQALANGTPLKAIVKQLNHERVAPPGGPGGRSGRWHSNFLRDSLIPDDVYKPHTYDEIVSLVDKDVAAKLDPDQVYGIFWYNRYRNRRERRTVENSSGEKRRVTRHIRTERPREEWIAIPVPDAGIPLNVVEAARAGIKDNKPYAKQNGRLFELSGGIALCGECGRYLVGKTTKTGGYTYYYYGCRNTYTDGTCKNTKKVRADKLEPMVADIVSQTLSDEGRLTAEVDALIQKERDALARPEAEARAWAGQIADCGRKRKKYQEMFANDLMTADELRENLKELDERKAEAERELAAADTRLERIAELERDKAALIEAARHRAETSGLSEFTPEERREIYRRLRLVVYVYPDQTARISGDIPLAVGYLDQDISITNLQEDEEGVSGTINFGQTGVTHTYSSPARSRRGSI